jgi:hypothetical protein
MPRLSVKTVWASARAAIFAVTAGQARPAQRLGHRASATLGAPVADPARRRLVAA